MSQFIHLETYSSGQSKAGGWTADDIAGEAIRAEGHHPHVPNPGEPRLLHGEMPDVVNQRITAQLDRCVDRAGRRIQKRTQHLVAGVVSFPIPMNAKTPGNEHPDYQAWVAETLDFLKSEFGDQLESMIEHTDEAFPHLHFYVSPKFEAAELDAHIVQRLADRGVTDPLHITLPHPGIEARTQARLDRKATRDQNIAYKEAMSAFQDRFHGDVSAKFGHDRLGPGRDRLTRKNWFDHKKRLAERQVELTLATDKLTEAEDAIDEAEAALGLAKTQRIDAERAVEAAREASQAERRSADELLRAATDAEAKAAQLQQSATAAHDALQRELAELRAEAQAEAQALREEAQERANAIAADAQDFADSLKAEAAEAAADIERSAQQRENRAEQIEKTAERRGYQRGLAKAMNEFSKTSLAKLGDFRGWMKQKIEQLTSENASLNEALEQQQVATSDSRRQAAKLKKQSNVLSQKTKQLESKVEKLDIELKQERSLSTKFKDALRLAQRDVSELVGSFRRDPEEALQKLSDLSDRRAAKNDLDRDGPSR